MHHLIRLWISRIDSESTVQWSAHGVASAFPEMNPIELQWRELSAPKILPNK